MINEEIESKAFSLAARIGKISASTIKKALEKLIASLTEKKNEPQKTDKDPELKQGKQTFKQLQKHNEGLSTVELTDPNLRQLNRAMKKDGVDFAAVKDGKGKYTLFFKGKDADTLTHAFQRYTKKLVKQSHKGKPSINKALAAAKAQAQTINTGRDKEKTRSKGALDR